MNKFFLTVMVLLCISTISKAQDKVGINTTSPGSALSVNGNAAIGTNYATQAAPTNGAIIEGNVGIGTPTPAQKLDVNGDALINGMTVGKGIGNFNSNTAIGYQVLLNNTTGGSNTAIGYQALLNNSTGGLNEAIGFQALLNNTTGTLNTGNGYQALYSNTTGNFNTATGSQVLNSNTTGNLNVATGYTALFSNTTGNNNTAYGSNVLQTNTTGGYNNGMGTNALLNNITGGYNIAIGSSALENNVVGGSNVAIGSGALYYNFTGNNNTALGYLADVASGSLSNSTAIGYAATATASNQIRLGNSTVTSIGGFANYTNVSDGRFKYQVNENIPGLAFIQQLRPVSYHLDAKKYDAHIMQNMSAEMRNERMKGDYTASSNIVHSGFIAQEIEAAAKAVGYDFDGLYKPQNETDTYGIAYSQFIMPMVKAMQEQQAMIEALKAENAALKANASSTEADINLLKAQVEKLNNSAFGSKQK